MRKFKIPMVALMTAGTLLASGGIVAQAEMCVTSSGCRDAITYAGGEAMNSRSMEARHVRATMRKTGGSGSFTARIQRRNSAGNYVNHRSSSRETNGTTVFESTNYSTQTRFRIRATGNTSAAGTARIVRLR